MHIIKSLWRTRTNQACLAKEYAHILVYVYTYVSYTCRSTTKENTASVNNTSDGSANTSGLNMSPESEYT